MIFTALEMLFFFLGVLSTLGIGSIIYFNKKYRFNAGAWACIGIGLFLLIFCVAWSASSYLEGEPRASSMGMLFFGIPSIILMVFGRRLALNKKASQH